MTSIFISYDRDDRPLTRQLANQLRRVYGFDQVWYDENIRGGEDWWNEIQKQIASRDIFMYLLSDDSAKSPYCQAEHAEAKRLSKEVLPVRITEVQDIPDFLRQIQYVDMSEGSITVENFTELNAAIKQISDKIEYLERRRLVAANSKPRSRLGLLLVPLAVLILIAVGMLVTTPAPPFQGKIAYTSGRTAISNLLVSEGGFNGLLGKILGNNPRTLPGQIASDSPAVWSPDGNRIAFAQRGENGLDLYVMKADGSNVQRLTTDSRNYHYPSWSPDGRQLTYTAEVEPGNTDVFVMDVDFSDPANVVVSSVRNLTNAPGEDDYAVWSPDGAEIAFSSNRDGEFWNIYLMDGSGGDVRPLTSGNGDNESPAWSPDGTQIAFESNRERRLGGADVLPDSTNLPGASTEGVANWDVYVMDTDGTGVIPFTKSPASDRYPNWSPDGKQLVFASDRDGDYDLYLVEVADRKKVTLLTDNTAENDLFTSWRQ
ncbi:MAG: TIR domain-containing protein [Anaerolineae bacterium]|nr:TIR domain-containing protein [Anaerolineae bacterium]